MVPVAATRSLVCVLTWVFRLSGRLKEAEQKEQVKGCFPEWEATWRLLALESENVFLQRGQSYGFSPLGNTQLQVSFAPWIQTTSQKVKIHIK